MTRATPGHRRGPVRLLVPLCLCAALATTHALSAQSAAPHPVVEGHVTGADGVQLFYRQIGTGRNVTVLLHGGPGLNIGASWPDLVPLADHFTIMMYDQRGAGRSQIVKDSTKLTATDHVRDLEAIRQHFGWKQMALVGHSWGAGLAILYAAAHPDRVSRMLLVGPMPPTAELYTLRQQKLTAHDTAAAATVVRLLGAISTSADPANECRQFVAVYFPTHFADPAAALRLKADPCDVPPDGLRNFPFVGAATMGSLGNWNFTPLLARLRMPVLVVDGAKSPATLEGVHALAGALGNGRLLLVPNAGHYAQVEQPDGFFPPVEQFLGGEWPSDAVVEPHGRPGS